MSVGRGAAFAVGIYSAIRQYSVGDHLFTFLSFGIPPFLLALVDGATFDVGRVRTTFHP